MMWGGARPRCPVGPSDASKSSETGQTGWWGGAAGMARLAFAARPGNAAPGAPFASPAGGRLPGRYSADSSAALPALGPAQRLPRSRADGALGVTDASWSAAHKLDTTAG